MNSNLRITTGYVVVGIAIAATLAGCNSSSKSDSDGDEAPARSSVDNGYIVSSLESFDSNGALGASYEYVTDYDENTISTHDVLSPDRPVVILNRYDTKGYLSIVTRYSFSSSEVNATETYEWDSNGRLKSVTNETPIGTEFIKFTYDENDRLISRQAQYTDSSDVVTASFSYDENGNLASLSQTANEPSFDELSTFTYNEQNQRTGAIFNVDGVVAAIRTIQYDLNGNIASIENAGPSGELYDRDVFTYETATEPVTNLPLFSEHYFP